MAGEEAPSVGEATDEGGNGEEGDIVMEAEIYPGRAQWRGYGKAERGRQAEQSMEVEMFSSLSDGWSAEGEQLEAIL